MRYVSKNSFGHLENGETVLQYTLKNRAGMRVSVLNLGCTITEIHVPDQFGIFDDVVLGFDTLSGYLETENTYFGCIIGRVSNRISNACVAIDKNVWHLTQNHGKHHIHGGFLGFDKKIWQGEILPGKNNQTGVSFTYTSPHLEEGYPGNLTIRVTVILTEDNIISISYLAESDMKTVVNLTNHSYFNLLGLNRVVSNPSGSVLFDYCGITCLDHHLKINARYFTESDRELIPTGNIIDVSNLPIDFRSSQRIRERIFCKTYPMEYTKGYDHNFIINRDDKMVRFAAELFEPVSGRCLEIYTTQPCMQLYTGNFIPENLKGKNNTPYRTYAGLCLETQNYPDATRHSQFKSTILPFGQTYRQTTEYRFSTRKET